MPSLRACQTRVSFNLYTQEHKTKIEAFRGLSDNKYGHADVKAIAIVKIIIAEMTVFNVAGYLIEERRRWPVITASPRGQYSK